jgi:hypothetical protein
MKWAAQRTGSRARRRRWPSTSRRRTTSARQARFPRGGRARLAHTAPARSRADDGASGRPSRSQLAARHRLPPTATAAARATAHRSPSRGSARGQPSASRATAPQPCRWPAGPALHARPSWCARIVPRQKAAGARRRRGVARTALVRLEPGAIEHGRGVEVRPVPVGSRRGRLRRAGPSAARAPACGWPEPAPMKRPVARIARAGRGGRRRCRDGTSNPSLDRSTATTARARRPPPRRHRPLERVLEPETGNRRGHGRHLGPAPSASVRGAAASRS